MPKKIAISMDTILSEDNLLLATHKAARSKRDRESVKKFTDHISQSLQDLRSVVLNNALPLGEYRSFKIFDPKPRIISAVAFPYRVLHHAIMNLASPIFNTSLIDHTYACRPNKGAHKAAVFIQHQLQRFPWYVKIDIDHYFASISHSILQKLLARYFKGSLLQLFSRILASYSTKNHLGLPIGSLTSQYFANEYLNQFDRFMLSLQNVRSYCRYMDDAVWWCHSEDEARSSLFQAKQWLIEHRNLSIKKDFFIRHSNSGVDFCGFEIRAGVIHPARRKRRRFLKHWKAIHDRYKRNQISDIELQKHTCTLLGMLAYTDSRGLTKQAMTDVLVKC